MHSPAVDAYLRHLAAEGFETQVEGTILAESVWPAPERSLHEVGVMVRRLHEIGRTFTPPPDARWMPWTLHSASGPVISHGNIAPWHVVFRDDRPAGLTGWEYAGPVDPLDEVAVTAFYCAQLFDDDLAAHIGLPSAVARAGWFRAFLDGYELPLGERADLVERILRWVIRDNGWYARVQGFTRTSADAEGLWTLVWQSRAGLWTLEHRTLLLDTAQLAMELPRRHELFEGFGPGELVAEERDGRGFLFIARADEYERYAVDLDSGAVVAVSDLSGVWHVNESVAAFVRSMETFTELCPFGTDDDCAEAADEFRARLREIDPTSLREDPGHWHGLLHDIAIGDYSAKEFA